MKRLLIVVVVLVVVAAGAFAFTFSDFQTAAQDFANGVSSALPLESSVGLNWSDAYIGQLLDVPPHFGVGVTVGAATMPYSAIQGALSTFGVTLPPEASFMTSYGVPLPAYTVDVRIGGFVLPFDIGLKFGYLPPGALSSFGIGGFSADYLTIGGDIRFGLIQDRGVMPGLSVGVGYTYMRGNIGVPGMLGGPITVTAVSYGSTTHTIGFTDPSLNFLWNSSVIDAKVQLSKTLFIITPFIGLGASYGISSAGAGMQSTMTVVGSPATQSDLDQINSTYGTNYTLENPGFGVTSAASGFSARVFGGFSFNIFILKIGVGAAYEFLSGSMAGVANARIQL